MTQDEKLELLRKLVQLKNQREQKVETEKFEAEEKAFEEAPWYEKAGAGAGASILKTAIGLQKAAKGIGLPISEESLQQDIDALDYRQRQAKGGWGTAGSIAGDVAQLAIPGGAAVRGARALQSGGAVARGAGRALPLATDVASSAGLAALQGREGMTAGEAAKEGAKEAAIGALGGFGLNKLLKGVSRSQAGDELIKAGVPLTPSQAAQGPLPRAVATATQFVPFLSRVSQAARERAASKFDNYALNQAAPPGINIEGSGAEGFRELRTKVDDAYDAAWEGAKRLTNQERFDFTNQLRRAYQRYGETPAVRNQLVRMYEEFGQLTKDYTPENIRRFDKKIRDSIDAVSDDAVVRDELKDIRSFFKDKSGVSEKLAPLDKAWPRIRSAVRSGASEKMRRQGGGVDPFSLSTGSGVEGGMFNAAELAGPMDRIAQQGMQAFEPLPTFLPSRRAALSKFGLDMELLGDFMTRVGTGQTIGQRGGASLADALRRAGVSGSTVYTAQADEE